MRNALYDLGACAAQQPSELILGQRIGYRRHGAEDRRRVGSERDRDRKRLARRRECVIAEVERAAAMRQPAHDQLVLCEHLLPVDAQVLALLERAARDGESPGDQRRDIARPTGLNREALEIELRAFPNDLLARRCGAFLRRHVHDLQEHRPRVLPRVLQSLRRLGLLEEREEPADFAQRGDRLFAHTQGHALRRAEKIAQHRDPRAPAHTIKALRFFEQQRRPVRFQHTIADLGHLQPRIDLDGDAFQLSPAFKLGEKIAEVGVFHRGFGACSIGRGHLTSHSAHRVVRPTQSASS